MLTMSVGKKKTGQLFNSKANFSLCSFFKCWKSWSRLNSSTVNGRGGIGGRGVFWREGFLKLNCWLSSFAISPTTLSTAGVDSSAAGVSSTSVCPASLSATPVNVFNTTASGSSSSNVSASPATVSPAGMSASHALEELMVVADIVVSVVPSAISLYCILIICIAAISNKVKSSIFIFMSNNCFKVRNTLTLRMEKSLRNYSLYTETFGSKFF
uniref:Uncharacterized protein n=1 Tax=Glossina palpalis gambiensis TaxID=67801 RepID=A0A1B0B0R8_9MUSC